MLSFDALDVNVMTQGDDWTPLIRAVAYGNDDVAMALLNCGRHIHINQQDFVGNNVLMFLAVRQASTAASVQLQSNLTSLLIEKGVEMNTKVILLYLH